MTRDPTIPKSGEQPLTGRNRTDAQTSAASDIAAFVAKARAMTPGKAGTGRLIFALDATMSRQPTWDMACQLQADMFREAGSIGGLSVRLVYYRGLSECRASPWISDTAHLARLMSKIDCQGGQTQLGRVLADARREAVASGVRAIVFVGDAMEENVDALCATAGELGLLKVPCFMFQEGNDPAAEAAFREIARLTGGAWCRFDMGSAAQLRELLRAAAAYAAGGRDALMRLAKNTSGAAALLGQMKQAAKARRYFAICRLNKSRYHHRSGMRVGGTHCCPEICKDDQRPMPTLIAGIVAVALLYVALNIIKGADPKWLAKIIRGGGGVVTLAAALFIGARGELAVAIPLGIFGAGLLGWSPFGAQLGSAWGNYGPGAWKSQGQKSQVRSQFIEMTLDHDTGALEGLITAGPEAGRVLDEFTLDELIALARGFDAESWALLESYLDRRFPAWREHAQGEGAGRGGSEDRRAAPGGKMTAEEAYQILGLKPGAGRDEISRAHRGLMKKLHPDQGGSTYLAARVNEAKDTLLRNHR